MKGGEMTMEMSKKVKNKKQVIQSAFYFSIGMFCLGIIISIAILFLEQLHFFFDDNSLRKLIYFAFILVGALIIVSIAGFMAGAYRVKPEH
jgi:energy-converting hydrogenase Eha subunit G